MRRQSCTADVHNCLAIYDNVKFLPPWFSDEVCKAVLELVTVREHSILMTVIQFTITNVA